MDPSDPLFESSAPRYAIESDEEEDEPNPLRIAPSTNFTAPSIKLIFPTVHSHLNAPLIVASGRAGAFWARGADLGEQQGGVYVDKVQIGLLFTPPQFSPSTVLISEPISTLPLPIRHPYAQTVLDELKPCRVVLLDTYSTPTYANEEGGSLHEAPVRFVSTAEGEDETEEGKWKERLDAKPFAPPNLLQSTTSAFLLALRVSSLASPLSPNSNPLQHPTTALLLPSLHIPTPPPKVLLPSTSFSSFSSSADDSENTWSAGLMQGVSETLLELAGVNLKDVEGEVKWEPKGGAKHPSPAGRRSEVGEGGMYL